MNITDSLHQWLNKAQKAFPFFDGILLVAVFDGNFWIWPPSLEFYPCPEQLSKEKDSVAIAWDQPSFFRICRKTAMPYHGYVVPSPVHDRLYAYLKTRVPQHVTLLPILNKEQLVALLYLDKKEVDNVEEIPLLQALELKWESLAYEFNSLYKLKRTGIISAQSR